MQAIIMAAGEGKRISGYSKGLPKCFLKINNKALIDYQVDSLTEYGVKNIVIVVGYKKELFWKKYAARKNIALVDNPDYATTNVLMSFQLGMKYLSDDFLFFHADTYFERRILEMLIKKQGAIVLPVELKQCGKEDMKVVLNEKKQVQKISKDIPVEEASGEFIGIAKLRRQILPYIKKNTEYFINKKEFSHYFEAVIQKCIDDKTAFPEIVDVTNMVWNEIDFKEDYENILNMLR